MADCPYSPGPFVQETVVLPGQDGSSRTRPSSETYTEDNISLLGLACSYRLIGGADTEFPTTFSASPSRVVWVVRTPKPLVRPYDEKKFPVVVGWRVWHMAVVPTLNAYRLNPRSLAIYRTERMFMVLVGQVTALLRQNLALAKLIPSEYPPPEHSCNPAPQPIRRCGG